MFAAKAWVALGPGDHRKKSQRKLLDTLKALQINFNNGTLNKVMVRYIVDLADETTWSRRCAELLQWIERDCGVDVLSAGYAKLGKILQICGKEALASSQHTSTLMEYVLGYLWTGMTAGALSPKKVNMDLLDNGPANRGGKPGESSRRLRSERSW